MEVIYFCGPGEAAAAEAAMDPAASGAAAAAAAATAVASGVAKVAGGGGGVFLHALSFVFSRQVEPNSSFPERPLKALDLASILQSISWEPLLAHHSLARKRGIRGALGGCLRLREE